MSEFVSVVAPFSLFAGSLFLLIKFADIFVNNAEKLGKALGIPHFIIGVTVVAIGTSIPELATAIVPVLRSTPENDLTPIVAGNVIGSNIANILLGVGIASLFRNVKVDRELVNFDLPFLFGGTGILIYFLSDGVLNRVEGLLLLLGFLIFVIFSVVDGKAGEAEKIKASRKEVWKFLSLIVAGAFGVAISSDFTITNLETLSINAGIPADTASMFFLAVGTSFPEIFVTVVMTRKKHYSMAVGNILGSNIANSLGIVGIAGSISALTVAPETILIGLPFVAIATLYFIFSGLDKQFTKWEGLMAIAIFIMFLGKIFHLA